MAAIRVRNRGRYLVRLAAYAGDGAARTIREYCRRILTLIEDHPVTKRIRGDRAQLAGLFRAARAFEVQKKIQAVFHERPSHGGAEDVADEFRCYVGFALRQLSSLHEIIIGTGIGVAVVFVSRAMKIIGSALGNEGHLRSGGASLVGIVVRCRYAKLLYRVQRDRQHGLKGVTARVVYWQSVQSDVALVAARTIDRAISGVNIHINVRAVSGI